MKEERYFYVPDAERETELPTDEAVHAIRVLRLNSGDDIFLMNGCGMFFRAQISMTTSKRCFYEIVESLPQQRAWKSRIHLAIAPTKMMDRMEWMAEKATEVGFDELSFLECRFSERRQLRVDRIEKIVVSAAKQSRKPWLPVIHAMQPFHQFISQKLAGRRFIAHCYDEIPRTDLFQSLKPDDPSLDAGDVTILVGPEGDFSVDEVRQAIAAGYESVSLGTSRLRTETAGLAAVLMSHLRLRLLTLLAVVLTMCCSCSRGEYTRVLPPHCSAIMAADVSEWMGSATADVDWKATLAGLNPAEKVFLFIAPDGNFGVCASVRNATLLRTALEALSQKGKCSHPVKLGNEWFAQWAETWMIGFNDDALLMLGPVAAADRQAIQARLSRWLSQKEGQGLSASGMFDRLVSMDAPFAFVSQVAALPEELATPLLLGVPKNTDAAQVLLAATISRQGRTLLVDGETYSTNKHVDAGLKASRQVFRPIKGRFTPTIPVEAQWGMLVNVDGQAFLPLMQAHQSLQELLAGVNMAIDMDNILRGVDGDLVIVKHPSTHRDTPGDGISMVAELGSKAWLADVDYWKQSCPPGASITDWAPHSYCYTDGHTSFFFGVTPSECEDTDTGDGREGLFFSGSSADQARQSLCAAVHPLDPNLNKLVAGQTEVFIFHLPQAATAASGQGVVPSVLSVLWGQAETVVFRYQPVAGAE